MPEKPRNILSRICNSELSQGNVNIKYLINPFRQKAALHFVELKFPDHSSVNKIDFSPNGMVF